MNRLQRSLVCVLVGAACGTSWAQSRPASEKPAAEPTKRPVLLLIDDQVHPTVELSWVVGGDEHTYAAQLPFTAPSGGEPLQLDEQDSQQDSNIRAYVAMGGTRVETGAGHPKGAVLRVGLTKIDSNRAFFTRIDPRTEIELGIVGVRFNQPVKAHENTGMMHLKYALGDLKACALPGTARNQYLLSDPEDTLGGRIIAGENATPGALDGQPTHGDLRIEIDPDDPTLVSLFVRVPYGYLRHLQDPWESDLPGTFFEPIHLHAEAELIPIDTQPLDREPILPETNPSQEQSREQS